MSEAQALANPLGTERISKLLRGFAIPGIISPISMIAIALSSLFGDGLAT